MEAKITYDSPLGPMTVAASEKGLTALVFVGQKYEALHVPPDAQEGQTPLLKKARAWLDRYFAGQNPDSAELPLDLRGTDFQRRVWNELRSVPCGAVVSHGELARRLGTSARAVGAAVGRNPVSIVVPCHRVVGADGSLTGYAAGVDVKRRLLELEGVLPAAE